MNSRWKSFNAKGQRDKRRKEGLVLSLASLNFVPLNLCVEKGDSVIATMLKPKSVIRDYFEQGLITVIMALFGMTFVLQAVEVPTGSLQNTIYIGDHFFVNKFIFGRRSGWLGPVQPAREIQRGDIIVFKLPSNPKINYVKRVIGLPGDQVQYRDMHVFVNGQQLPEQHVTVDLTGNNRLRSALPEIKTEPAPSGATYKVYYESRAHSGIAQTRSEHAARFAVREPYTVPPDSYFVMGDSRDNSEDSRFWGTVPRSNVIARALYVHWSYNRNDPENRQYGLGPLDVLLNTRWARTGAAIK
jgi:signal peptidase I